MKHLFAISLACVAMAAQLESSATVWRVNNQGFSADFNLPTALQDAIASSSVGLGDTLHVEPSPVSYGDITLNKRLVLIGPGYFLNQNVTPSPLQQNPVNSSVLKLMIDTDADGSKVLGLTIQAWVYIRASNILIDRCYGQGGLAFSNGVPLDNVVTSRSYFLAGSGGYAFGGNGFFTPAPITNLLVTNCYFGDTFIAPANFQQGSVVTQCVFTNGVNIDGIAFTNNIVRTGIMLQNNNGINNVHHNIFHNNPGSWVGSAPVNFPNTPMTQVFAVTGTTDGIWTPIGLCTACSQGVNGAQIGMYGGSTPYILSGIPSIPTIYQLTTNATAEQGQPLPVTISTRSND